MTKGLLKSSKKKQKLYDKFLKNKTNRNHLNHKTYNNLFKQIKNKSKKNYYQNLLLKYKNNIKKTWDVIKEVIGKTKLRSSILPRRLIIDNIETYDKKVIANKFNNYFVDVGPNLAANIPTSSKHFETYLSHNESSLLERYLTDEEFATAYFSLKTNKSPGYDEVNANVIINTFKNISKPLKYIFNESLNQGIFPEKLKIARITPIFKHDEETSVTNYRPISVLPCFSKILERIMYNRLYTFLCENNILYEKQFDFQTAHSTDHAIIQLANEISKSFEEDKFTLGV